MASVCRRILRKCLRFLYYFSSCALFKKKKVLSNLFPFFSMLSVFVVRDLHDIICVQLEMYFFRLSDCK